jgi:hypothetical protein
MDQVDCAVMQPVMQAGAGLGYCFRRCFRADWRSA